MKKNKIAVFLVAAMISASMIAGCGGSSSSSETTSTTETKIVVTEEAQNTEEETEEEVSIANPWTDSDEQGIMNATGLSFEVPENAQDVTFRLCESLGIAEMDYTDENGVEICARIKATGEAEDISGLYYEWAEQGSCMVGRCDGETMKAQDAEGTVLVCTWFDMVPGISYSVSASAESLDDFDIVAVAQTVYAPAQGEATADLPETGEYSEETYDYSQEDASIDGASSGETVYTCPDDGSTITLGEDGSVVVSIYRLSQFEGTAELTDDGVMTFYVIDPNDGDMTMEFDTSSGVLTVTESNWDLLPTGETFNFQ